MVERTRLVFIFAVVYAVFLAFNLFFSGGVAGYDTARNEKITTELAYYGTFTYFDVPFLVSPPLYFIIHSFPVGIFGDGLAVFRFTEATMYFLGALLAFFIVMNLGLPRKTATRMGLFVFFLLLIDSQTFGAVRSIDFGGAVLLFSALVLLFYLKMYKKPSVFNVLGFGIVVGLSMLVKSSFVFFIAPLALHYLIFSLAKKDLKKIAFLLVSLFIGVAVYSPWMYYLSSNGFDIVTNPEAKGELPWDPDFKGYSFQDVYMDVWVIHWPILYPFSILMGLYLIFEHCRSARFESGVKWMKKIKYYYYRHGNFLGAAFAGLLMVIVLLPFFNRLLIIIPVAEQFFSISLAFYIVLGIVFFKTRRREVQYLIAVVLIVNFAWYAASVNPVLASQEYQNTCELYTEFFSGLDSSKALLIDEKLSVLTYPVHNVLYQPFFEWFSYDEGYDVLRIVTMNVDYVVLIDSERIPGYLNSGFFERLGEYDCVGPRGELSFDAVVFGLKDRDSFAKETGLGEKVEFSIMSGNKPVQATILVSGEGFNMEYKSKRDGSLTVYFPGEGSYSMNVLRTGFKPKSLNIAVPASGKTLINLKGDSPFIIHSTVDRF